MITTTNKRLESFHSEHLGSSRKGNINLTPHNPRWKRIYSDEAYLIFHKLKIEYLKLYHIGSTAVTIYAKPIIDIIGQVPSIELIEDKREVLEKMGYEYKGEYGLKGSRFFILSDHQKKRDFCHLHFFESSHQIEDHLLFRDYLRDKKNVAHRYELLKQSLCLPRNEYSEEKADHLKKILSEAKAWQKRKSKDKKTLAILGASEGHTKTESFLKEAYPRENDKSLEILDLVDFSIAPFSYKILQTDDFSHLVKKILQADEILFATPVYWYAMSGKMKDFFDRLSDLLSGEGKALGEKLNGKKISLLATGSDLELPLGFTIPFNLTCLYFGMDFMKVSYKSTR